MKRIVTSIWFLALVIAIPAILVFPEVFDKYQVKLKSKEKKIEPNSIRYFKDLDSDGDIERIECYQAAQNIFSFQCFDDENKLEDQYNFPHFCQPQFVRLFFSDFDKDKLLEVYGFTVYKDSVFLNWVEPFDTIPVYHSKFVTTIDTERRKTLDVGIRNMAFFDFDEDGREEIAFSLAVGYNWFPRKLFVYHPDIDSLSSTKNYGSHFDVYEPFDFNNDESFELLCISSSAQNIPGNIDVDYKDDRPRLFVFNKNLEVVFEPVEFPHGFGSNIRPFFLNDSIGELITLYHDFSSENAGTFVTKVRLDNNAFISDTLFIYPGLAHQVDFLKENNNKFIVFTDRGNIYQIDSNLELLDSINLNFINTHTFLGIYDIFKDEKPEYYICDNDNNVLFIYFEDFKRKVALELEGVPAINSIIPTPRENEFIVNTVNYQYYYTISKSKFYFLKYPMFLFIYLMSVLFIWLLQIARMRQLKEKYDLQNKVHELQLKTLKNQLDPHFIYNTFNTIASVIKQGRNEEAYDLFVRLSKMVRINLDSSASIYITLKDEMKFVEDYLSIQKFRFKDMFDFKIKIDKKVNMQLEIPKMIVLIHVENALKHGLRQDPKNGKLRINLFKDEKEVVIEIEDDGIGRKKSKFLNKGREGIGLSTIKKMIEISNQNRSTKITQKIIDLKDEKEQAAGTKVVLKIEGLKMR